MFRSLGTKWSVGGSVLVFLPLLLFGPNGQWVVQFWPFFLTKWSVGGSVLVFLPLLFVLTKWSVGGSVLVFLALFGPNGQWVVRFWSFWHYYCLDQMVSGWFGFGLLAYFVWTKWSVGGSSIGLFGPSG